MTEFQPQQQGFWQPQQQPQSPQQQSAQPQQYVQPQLQPQEYGQPQPQPYAQSPQYAHPQQPQPQAYPAPYIEDTRPSGALLALGAVAGLAAGLVAAFAYATFTMYVQRELLWFMVFVGVAVGFCVSRVSRRTGALPAIVSLVVGVPAVFAAAALVVAFGGAGSIPDGLAYVRLFGPVDLLRFYFEDFLGYVWVGAGVVASAAAGATGMRK